MVSYLTTNGVTKNKLNYLFKLFFSNKTSYLLSTSKFLPWMHFERYVLYGKDIMQFISNRKILVTDNSYFHPHLENYNELSSSIKKTQILNDISSGIFVNKLNHIIHTSSPYSRMHGMLELFGLENESNCLQKIIECGGVREKSEPIITYQDPFLVKRLSDLINQVKPYGDIFTGIDDISTSFVTRAMMLSLQSQNIHFSLVNNYMSTKREIYPLYQKSIPDTWTYQNKYYLKKLFDECTVYSNIIGTSSLIQSLNKMNEKYINQYLSTHVSHKMAPIELIKKVNHYHCHLVDPIFLINYEHFESLKNQLKCMGYVIEPVC